jgi:hypothetical protein
MVLASARKMKRTHRQEQAAVENMNRQGLNYLLQTQEKWIQQFIEMQKNQLALMRVLERRGIITELEIAQELSKIEELEQMKRDAIIIDPNKKG